MNHVAEVMSGDLLWVYPDPEHQGFLLHASGKPVGWFRLENEAGGDSTAEIGGQRWTFERTGPHRSHIAIRVEGAASPDAEFVPHGMGGIVTFANGARYCWGREHIWSTRWCFRCVERQSMVCVSQEPHPLAIGTRVTICAQALERPEIPILVLLAWYLRLLEFERLEESMSIVG